MIRPLTTHMRAAARSYFWYYGHFWRRFVQDALTWRVFENLGSFILAVAILVCQVYFGVVRIGEGRPQFLAIAFPYAMTLLAWLLFHFTATSWRLDRDRDELQGPPIDIDALTDTTGGTATVTVRNLGFKDDFTVEITGVSGWDSSSSPTFPLHVRWGGKTQGTVMIDKGNDKSFHLLTLPKPESLTPADPPAAVLYSATQELEGRLRWKDSTTRVPERLVVHLRVRSRSTGRSKEMALISIASLGSVRYYREIYIAPRSTPLQFSLPKSPPP